MTPESRHLDSFSSSGLLLVVVIVVIVWGLWARCCCCCRCLLLSFVVVVRVRVYCCWLVLPCCHSVSGWNLWLWSDITMSLIQCLDKPVSCEHKWGIFFFLVHTSNPSNPNKPMPQVRVFPGLWFSNPYLHPAYPYPQPVTIPIHNFSKSIRACSVTGCVWNICQATKHRQWLPKYGFRNLKLTWYWWMIETGPG